MLIVVDKLQTFGGAENVVIEIARTFPNSIIYSTSIQDAKYWQKLLPSNRLMLPWWGKMFSNRTIWLIFYPLICILASMTKIKTSDDVLVYSSSAGKFFNFSLDAKKIILYSNYPARGIFFPAEFFKNRLLRTVLSPFLYTWRIVERRQYHKFSKIVCISAATRQAFIKSMNIFPDVLNCPIRREWFLSQSDSLDVTDASQSSSTTLMLISRLEKWKGLDFVLHFFNSTDSGIRLDVYGEGGEFKNFKKKYPNVQFLGYVSDINLMKSTNNYFGLVFPTVQEWSLVPTEANSRGLPVLSVDCLSISETQIIATSIFNDTDVKLTCLTYRDDVIDSLNSALTKLMNVKWDRRGIMANAKRFHPDLFAIRLKKLFK